MGEDQESQRDIVQRPKSEVWHRHRYTKYVELWRGPFRACLLDVTFS